MPPKLKRVKFSLSFLDMSRAYVTAVSEIMMPHNKTKIQMCIGLLSKTLKNMLKSRGLVQTASR